MISIIASNTRRLISEKGYKQKSIAERAGYDQKTFSNMMNGRKLVTDLDIIAIANALDVTPNDLFAPTQRDSA